MGIILKNFPNRITKVKAVPATPRERLKRTMEDYAPVFEIGKGLKTMKGECTYIYGKS